MERTLTLIDAIRIAQHAHSGQRREGGESYFEHPVRVMLRVERMPGIHEPIWPIVPAAYKIVALLHDVPEDTDIGFETLRNEGATDIELAALVALTRDPQENYLTEYIPRVADNRVAILVKIADLHDNLAHMHDLKPERAARLEPKYLKALEFLVPLARGRCA